MTVRELDRLITHTQMSQASKMALRRVRRHVESGIVGDPIVGKAHWSISIDNEEGQPVTMNFTFKRLP